MSALLRLSALGSKSRKSSLIHGSLISPGFAAFHRRCYLDEAIASISSAPRA
jgi:hypothetical protein